MINVSENFKIAMKQPIKEIQAFIDCGDVNISDENDLISFKISCDSGLCKTAMRKLEAKILGNHALLGKWVKVGFGVRLPDGEFNFLNYGTFLVTEFTTSKDNDTATLVGYDLMINAMTPYTTLEIEYPMRLYDYTKLLCEACNLELSNLCFGLNLICEIAWAFGSINVNFENGVYNIDRGTNKYGGVYVFLNDIIESEKKYVLSYKFKKTSGTLVSVGGHNLAFSQSTFFVDGQKTSTSYYEGHTMADDNETHQVDVYFTAKNIDEITDFELYIQINRNSEENISYQLWDIMFYESNALQTFRPYNEMNDWLIERELWENIDGITYRDIFQQIAQATGTTCIISDDKVYFKPLTNTGESLTYDNMFKLKLEDIYGEINSVVLSRTPIVGEDVYKMNESSVHTNGLTEFKIENNEIVDKDRENAITPIYDALNGIYYYPFEATTEGLGWYEIGDNITLIEMLSDGTKKEYKTSLFNFTITVDGSVKETLKAIAETKTQTQYQYATSISKRVKNTEILVNKQDEYIKSLVSDMYDENGVVNEKYTSIYQDIENIIASVQHSGGGNLIQNSVMFAYDEDGNPANWSLEGTGTLKLGSDIGSLQKGGVSGHSFTLLEKQVRQNIPVAINTEDIKIAYSFSIRIKKDITGQCYVRLFNSVEDYMVVHLAEGESADYEEFKLTGLLPKENYYTLSIYATEDSNATFTDCMFAVGENTTQWTQANGELMNTQVNINLDGITVKSSVFVGDYTVISPLEFAGYSMVNGTPTKVFCLNKEVTEVEKLLAREEIAMPPIKIVPVTTGAKQGWAFVPYVKEDN